MNSVSYIRVLPSEHSPCPISTIPKLPPNSRQTVSVAGVTPLPLRFVVRFLHTDADFMYQVRGQRLLSEASGDAHSFTLIAVHTKNRELWTRCQRFANTLATVFPGILSLSSADCIRYDCLESVCFGVRMGSFDKGARGSSRADKPPEITGAEQRPSAIFGTHFFFCTLWKGTGTTNFMFQSWRLTRKVYSRAFPGVSQQSNLLGHLFAVANFPACRFLYKRYDRRPKNPKCAIQSFGEKECENVPTNTKKKNVSNTTLCRFMTSGPWYPRT